MKYPFSPFDDILSDISSNKRKSVPPRKKLATLAPLTRKNSLREFILRGAPAPSRALRLCPSCLRRAQASRLCALASGAPLAVDAKSFSRVCFGETPAARPPPLLRRPAASYLGSPRLLVCMRRLLCGFVQLRLVCCAAGLLSPAAVGGKAAGCTAAGLPPQSARACFCAAARVRR